MKLTELLLFILFATRICLSYTQNIRVLPISREILEKQSLDTYRNACLMLQELANWMSVVFKIKSVWASSTINQMTNSQQNQGTANGTSIPLPVRPKAGANECSSLRNLHVTVQTYAHFQAQLLQLKAILGSNFMHTSKLKLDNASVSLRERIKNIEAMNRTALKILKKLKTSEQELSSQADLESSRAINIIQEVQKGPDFLKYFQKQKNSLIYHIEEATALRQDLKRIHSLLHTSNFFQNLGKTLDNFFSVSAKSVASNENNITTVKIE